MRKLCKKSQYLFYDLRPKQSIINTVCDPYGFKPDSSDIKMTFMSLRIHLKQLLLSERC